MRRLVRFWLAGMVMVLLLGGIGAPAWAAPIEDSAARSADRIDIDCRRDPAAPDGVVGRDGRPANYLHACGNQLYDAEGRPVRITGINWFGLEGGDLGRMGLGQRTWGEVLDQIVGLGYNTIRLPFTNELLRPWFRPTGSNAELNPDLVGLSGLDLLDRLIDGARARNLRVVLDRHWPDSRGKAPLWYTRAVSTDQWVADWQLLAAHYLGNDTVIGFDLHNEPGPAATWGTDDPGTDWRLAAERAGNGILEVNPYLLIFVQGITREGNDWYWEGGDLRRAGTFPIRLQLAGRLVYSPRDYGPGVYPQGWFRASDFPQNMPAIWQAHWAYLAQRGLAPIVLGEVGGRSVGEDHEGTWQRGLLDYLDANGYGYFIWALNPNSDDTGGVLADDWQTVDQAKQSVYARYLAPLLPPLATGLGSRAEEAAGQSAIAAR